MLENPREIYELPLPDLKIWSMVCTEGTQNNRARVSRNKISDVKLFLSQTFSQLTRKK
jgi:hypothetical protein